MKTWQFFLKCLLVGVCLSASSFAAEDYYPFSNLNDQKRFETLTSGLRCLVCQNQNIAESNAGLASDLRDQVYEKIKKGESDKEILDYLVARYGNFILYTPPFQVQTLGLWLAPFLFFLIGVSYLIFYVRKHRERT